MIRFLRRDRCADHQGALLEFAARRAGGAEVRHALDHVERCERCERDLATTTLILHALRRLHDETLLAEPAADGWDRLRDRLQARPRRPSRLLSGMPGILAGLGICAALVGPSAIGGSSPVLVDDGQIVAPPTPAALAFEADSDRNAALGLLPAPIVAPADPASVTAGPAVPAAGVVKEAAGAEPTDIFRSLDGVRASAVARPGRPATSAGPEALALVVDRR